MMEYIVDPEPYKWKNEYTVNISIIDEQHKKFLEIINELLHMASDLKKKHTDKPDEINKETMAKEALIP